MERLRPNESIQAKLLRGFAFQSAVVLALAFSSIMLLDWRRANRDLSEMEDGIRADLDTKGQRVSINIGIMARSLVEDNAIASIREIVDTLTDRDPEIAYAAYMDSDMKPWAFRSKLSYGRNTDMSETLRDSMSLWASRIRSTQSRVWEAAEGEIIEFASPVVSPSGSHGVVRVGLDARPMQLALRNASEHVWQDRRLTFGAFLAAAIFAFLLSLLLSRHQSSRLTKPVLDLATFAQRIAGGDYGSEFKVHGEGEIALLADTFETMRRKIQSYMHRLESLVAEKVRQIGDLLENVEQGLFTFNLDLTVNPDFSSRACTILRLESLKDKTLEEVLRMTPDQAQAFRDWMDVVGREHAHKRWAKLARLAPVREISLEDESGKSHIVEIAYRKILATEGRIKIMALAEDVTETRALVRRLNDEKTRHASKVKIILGVAGHSEESTSEFMKDAGRRLDSMLDALLLGGPDCKRRVFFDCHTLKGNAGGFGFDALAQAAQEMETHLESFQGEAGGAIPVAMQNSMRVMDEERCKIGEVFRQLYGSLERPPVRMDPDKVERLRGLAEKATRLDDPEAVRQLVAACLTIRHRRFDLLTDKYQELLRRTGEKLGKEAELCVSPPEIELDPALISRVDESLVHILRNALAHGIEDPETRELRGKGKGQVELSYSRTDDGHVFSVRDDGNGIDGEALAEKAVAMGLLTRQKAASLDPEDKVELIFAEGLSTSLEADSISGRGQGMAIARERIRAMNGNLTVETRVGAGTRFTLTIPDSVPAGASLETLENRLPVAT
jgi:two-component system, chemotaxis family, sensor kinase CheA